MRILYLHQYFATPRSMGASVTGTRSYEFGRRLARTHEVHMVTSAWAVNGPGHRGWQVEMVEGMRVHRLAVPYSNVMDSRARIKAFVHFAVRSSVYAARLRADVILATSTPLTIALPGIYASRRIGVPLVFEVRDLWPEAPRQIGELRNPALYWLARKLELAAYRNARHVVALSPGMRDGVIATGVPPDRVSMIPNSCDLDLFNPDIDGRAMRERLGLGDRLCLLYFGTLGPANGLDFVLDAAAVLKRRGQRQAVLVLHGEGKMKPLLEQRARTEGLDNVLFSSHLPDKSMVAQLVASADVGMTIYKNLPVLYTCSPNKMFDTLAAGRPVLTNMPGWLSDLVTVNACGVAVRPDSAEDFADKVEELLARRSELPAMGRRARQLAESTFSRDVLANKLEDVLRRAATS